MVVVSAFNEEGTEKQWGINSHAGIMVVVSLTAAKHG